MAPGCIAPMCIRVKDHSNVLCEQLQQLRQQTGLVDLDIVCEGHYIKVHKVVMAASSKFFKEQLCKYNVQALVILRLEDFGLELRRDALNYVIEFIYTGEVNILGEKLTDFCQAAHNLGVIGLEHLPVPATRPPPVLHKDHILIADESELRGSGGLYHMNPNTIQQDDNSESNSKLHGEVHPFLNSLNNGGHMNPTHDQIVLLQQVERDETNRNEGTVNDQQDIIPISFGDTNLTGECGNSDQYRNISDMLPRTIPEMLHDSNFAEDWSLFSTHAGHIPQSALSTRQVKAPVSTHSTLNTEIHMGIPGSHTTLQALFDAASSADIAHSGGQPGIVKTSCVSTSGSPAHQSKADTGQHTSSTTAITTSSNSTSDTLVSPAASPRLQPSRPNSSLEFKQFPTNGSAVNVSTGEYNAGVGILPGVSAGKVIPSPGKSISSHGKLRVINQGLQQSENIQIPSLKDTNKNRRRSGAHSHTGHLPSQVSQVALSAQVSHTLPSHAPPSAVAGPSGAVRTSMRLMTVAAVSVESASANTADTETVVNPIAIAENDSESESDEEQDNVISNTGITTPLANWSAEEPWPTTNRENNWTHPVESVDTAPPSGAVWQLPANPPAAPGGPNSNSSIAASWNIREHPPDLSNVQRAGSQIPWNIPVSTTWCSVPQDLAKWETSGQATSTSVMTTPRAITPTTWTPRAAIVTPPPTVSWTHPETSPNPQLENENGAGGGGSMGSHGEGEGVGVLNVSVSQGEGSVDVVGGGGTAREGVDSSSSSSSGGETEVIETIEPGLTWNSGESAWPKTNTDLLSESRDMLAIRSGIPLALQNKAIRSGVPIGPFQNKRKRKSKSVDSNKPKKRVSISRGRGDLEVRKDLMIESQAQEYKEGGGQVEAHQYKEDGGEVKEMEDGELQTQDQLHGLLIEEEETSPYHHHDSEGIQPSPSNKQTLPRDPLSPSSGVQAPSHPSSSTGGGTLVGGGVHIKTVTKLNSELSCKQCGKSFYDSDEFNQHLTTHHNTEQILCQKCPEKCDGKESLKVHLYKVHGIGEVWRCEETFCNFETPSKPGYIKHVSDHIPAEEKQKKCIKCKKVFKTKYGLKLHLKEHFDERLACSVCDFQTAQKSNLARHMASKHSQDIQGRLLDENFGCTKCEFRCVTEHMLKNHILRKHTEKEAMRYHCDHCPYATVEKAALDKHRRFKHTNERPFMCDTCGFSTATASSMARHKRSHSQTKPHKCEICGHEYADKKRLRDHMYLHSDYKPFKCELCSYTCRRSDNLSSHIKRQHKAAKEEKEVKAVIPDSTSDNNPQQLQKVLEAVPGVSGSLPCSSVLTPHSISTIDISHIAIRSTPLDP